MGLAAIRCPRRLSDTEFYPLKATCFSGSIENLEKPFVDPTLGLRRGGSIRFGLCGP